MMLRSFIAVEIPPSVQQKIAEFTSDLRHALPKPLVRWVPENNIHLTLQFLGDISITNLDRLAEALRIEAISHPPFLVSAGNIGAFPSNRRARVLWVGLDAPPALSTLQRGIQATTAKMGYPIENRSFSPHLTIGRVNQNASAEELRRINIALDNSRSEKFGTFQVDAIKLFKSDLTPGGSLYTCLHTLRLSLP